MSPGMEKRWRQLRGPEAAPAHAWVGSHLARHGRRGGELVACNHLGKDLGVAAALLGGRAEDGDGGVGAGVLVEDGDAAASLDEGAVATGVLVEVDVVVQVGLEQLLAGGELDVVQVVAVGDDLGEVREVALLGEAAELVGVVQADVEEQVDLVVDERGEELLVW